jgi:hypothetical protein
MIAHLQRRTQPRSPVTELVLRVTNYTSTRLSLPLDNGQRNIQQTLSDDTHNNDWSAGLLTD